MSRDPYDDPYPNDPDRDERERGRDDYDDRADRDAGRDARAIRVAKARVLVPAIGLIVVAGFGVVSVLLGLVQFATLDAQFDEQNKQIEQNRQLTPQQKKDQIELMDKMREVFKVAWLPFYGLVGVCAVVTMVGGVKLLSLSGRGWAVAAAVLSITPFTSGCCLLGLVFGIWALVVLGQPDVKAGFAARRRAAYSPDPY